MERKINLPQKVKYIIDTLQTAGYEAYAVGGCVRDTLLERVPDDWDITTDAKPAQIKSLFHRTVDTGIEHGTVTVLLDKEGFEVTTYRIDGEYEDGRHPKEVAFTTNLREDLRRRDFTINAMAYNDTVGLVDIFDGALDLQNKVIRCVGNARERFSEDALRMLRAVRFSGQLGFFIEENTQNAIHELAGNLEKISAERIQAELVKLMCSAHPDRLIMAYETGMTALFFPEFDALMQEKEFETVGEHTIRTLLAVPADKNLRLTMLLHELAITSPDAWEAAEQFDTETRNSRMPDDANDARRDKKEHLAQESAKMARAFLKRLKFDNDTIRTVTKLISYQYVEPALEEETVRRLAAQIGMDTLEKVLCVKRADAIGETKEQYQKTMDYLDALSAFITQVKESGACLRREDLALSGSDLIALGITPGKQVGEVLSMLLELVLSDPKKNTRETLEKAVKS